VVDLVQAVAEEPDTVHHAAISASASWWAGGSRLSSGESDLEGGLAEGRGSGHVFKVLNCGRDLSDPDAGTTGDLV